MSKETDKQSSYLSYREHFTGVEGEDRGGKTGSKALTSNIDTKTYQLKKSIKDSTPSRKVKSGWTDRENFGEVIASAVAREITNSDNEVELVPKVALVYDKEKKRCLVASRYLNGVKGTLDNYGESKGVEVQKGSHVRVDLRTEATTEKHDKLYLGGEKNSQLRRDLSRNIAVSSLSGNHDVNPGNMLVVSTAETDRIALIDLGHAFNDLLNSSEVFGGDKHDIDTNRILNFFNREHVGGFPRPDESKLWRDYEGIVPSQELADALKEASSLSKKEAIKAGMLEAKRYFSDIIDDLSKDPDQNQEVIKHIMTSLVEINNNISKNPITLQSLDNTLPTNKKILDKIFNNIEYFYNTGQEEMSYVAKLMDLQCKVDKLISQESNKDEKLVEEMRKQYKELVSHHGVVGEEQTITWIKTDKKVLPFVGNLEAYVMHRSIELKKPQEKEQKLSFASAIKSKLSETITDLKHFVPRSTKAPQKGSHEIG